MADLNAFVLELSRDPHKVDALRRDPEAAMAEAQLSDEDKEILRSGDVDGFRRAVMPEGPDGENIILLITIIVLATQA